MIYSKVVSHGLKYDEIDACMGSDMRHSPRVRSREHYWYRIWNENEMGAVHHHSIT